MNARPISIQLYTLREAAAKDFRAVLKLVADAGYVGVEFAGLHGMKPAEVRKVLDGLGLVTSSSHGAFPEAGNVAEVVDTAKALGYTRHVSGFGPDQFATPEATRAAAAKAQAAAALLKPHGLTFGIHNHWWEFDHAFDGRSAHRFFMDAAPDVFAQIDTYWTQTGGADPVAVLKDYGARAPLLHIKDGPCVKDKAMTAVGKGIMDWPAVLAAASDRTEWLIVELDRCDTDMVEAVRESYRYLVGNGLARGRK